MLNGYFFCAVTILLHHNKSIAAFGMECEMHDLYPNIDIYPSNILTALPVPWVVDHHPIHIEQLCQATYLVKRWCGEADVEIVVYLGSLAPRNYYCIFNILCEILHNSTSFLQKICKL